MASPFSIKITDFGGMVPRRAETLLQDSEAQHAANCRLLSGALVGFHQLLPIEDLSRSALYSGGAVPEMAYVVGSDADNFVWLPFANRDVMLVRGPIINDAYDRYYWTGDGEPKYNTEARIRNGDPALLLGIPAPVAAPTVAPAAGSPLESRAYLYTFISPYGEEGPPSPATVETGGPGTWVVSGFDTTIPRIAERAPGTWKIRIYRTVAGEDQALYYYVDEIDFVPGGTPAYNDSFGSDEVVLNSALESEDWDPPPADLDYLVVHPDGFLAGFAGDDVYLSVPYRPHAWPQEHTLSTEFPIVALGVFGQSIAVATKSNPYILSGTDPLAMTFTKTTAVTPCLSRYGVVSFDFGVIFPSERGLVLIDGAQAETITEQLIIGTDWKRDYRPEHIQAAIRYDNQYMAFCPCPQGTENSPGFIFSPRERAAWSKLENFTLVTAAVHNPLTGKVHLVRGGYLYQWDDESSPRVQYVWRSKKFDFKKFINLGAARIYIDKEDDSDINDQVEQQRLAYNAEVFADAKDIPTDALAPQGHRGLAVIGQAVFGGTYRYADVTAGIAQRRLPFAGSPLIPEGLELGQDRLQFRVWADEKLVLDTLVEGEELISLPSGFKAQRWYFEVRAFLRISSVTIGTSPKALASA